MSQNLFLPSIVVLEKDTAVAGFLAGGLRSHFSVHVTADRGELPDNIARNHPSVLVMNIEHWRLNEVENLHREFPDLPIVCTHRVPDEEMWMAALEAGASDVCPSDDVNHLLSSVLRTLALSQSAAA
jgi:DNA-binding NarL/FixJ family response regulator